MNRFEQLLNAINARQKSEGMRILESMETAAQPLILWAQYLVGVSPENPAIAILEAARSAIVEASACNSVGFSRSAMGALRSEYEFFLAWTYYFEHRVECGNLFRGEADFMLPGATKKYLRDAYRNFERNFGVLQKVKKRKVDDPYRLLSAHVHGTSLAALPSYVDISAIVSPMAECEEIVSIQNDVSEYVSDVLVSIHAPNWPDLPAELRKSVQSRVGAKQLSILCGV